MNAVGGMAHSLFNFIGNLGSEISASDKKEKIIRKMQELHFDIFQAFDDLTDILEEIYNDEKIIIIPDYRDELIVEQKQRQYNIINNIPRIDNVEKRKEALVECLKLKPDNTDVYLKIIEYFPRELPMISELLDFVNIDIYEIKKIVTNTWLPSSEKFPDHVEWARKCIQIINEKQEKNGWVSDDLMIEFDTIVTEDNRKRQKALEEEDRKRRTIHQLQLTKNPPQSKHYIVAEGDSEVVLKDVSYIEAAEEAKLKVKELYENLHIRQQIKIGDIKLDRSLEGYTELVMTNDETAIRNVRDQIAEINAMYNIAPAIQTELDNVLHDIDIKKRTVQGTVFETREAADNERSKYVNGVKYDEEKERMSAREESIFVEAVRNDQSYQSKDSVFHALRCIGEIKESMIKTKAAINYRTQFEKTVIDIHNYIESETESAREAYSDRKKELQKDVRGWFTLVFLILGIITINRESEWLKLLALVLFASAIYTFFCLLKAQVGLWNENAKEKMVNRIETAQKGNPAIRQCTVSADNQIQIHSTVKLKATEELYNQSADLLKTNVSSEQLEQAYKLLLRAAYRGHAEAQYTLGQLYEKGSIENINSKYHTVFSKKWYNKSAEQGYKPAIEALKHMK